MKSVHARLDVQLYIECPNCKLDIDLINDSVNEKNMGFVDEKNRILLACFPDGNWSESHDQFEIIVECTFCSKEINVKTIEW